MNKLLKPKLVVLSAPSGAGKSTLATMLLNKYKDKLKLSISYTTRLPRGKEVNGEHYFFVNEMEFKSLADKGEFLEHAFVFSKYWYGTSRKFVESLLSKGQNVLFDIDVQGAESLKSAFGEDCITIYIMPPSYEELEARLKGRNTESDAAIAIRLDTAKKELKVAPSFDFRVINNDLDVAFNEIESILRIKKCI